MKARLQITLETEVGQYMQEIACWDRKEHRSEDIGLTLAESKSLLAAIQKILVERQVTEYLEARRSCPHCGKPRGQKGSHTGFDFEGLTLSGPRVAAALLTSTLSKTMQSLRRLSTELSKPGARFTGQQPRGKITRRLSPRFVSELIRYQLERVEV